MYNTSHTYTYAFVYTLFLSINFSVFFVSVHSLGWPVCIREAHIYIFWSLFLSWSKYIMGNNFSRTHIVCILHNPSLALSIPRMKKKWKKKAKICWKAIKAFIVVYIFMYERTSVIYFQVNLNETTNRIFLNCFNCQYATVRALFLYIIYSIERNRDR